jgi:manganese/iron transport system ATP-binding protein
MTDVSPDVDSAAGGRAAAGGAGAAGTATWAQARGQALAQAQAQAKQRPALVFDRVSVAYGRVTVLEKVHGSVAPGHAVALIGPNGAGKSTLIKAVLGLVPVVSGQITVLGRPPAQARRDVAYVPQADTLDSDFPINVAQVVLMGRFRRIGWVRRPKRADREAAAAALDAVGLAHRAHDRFGTLSGGQRQRVLLARAMASEPGLLLLDEPFNGVDAVSQDALLTALDTLQAGGATIVISTHDLALAHLRCDHVCLLNRHQFGFGPPAATLTPELLRAAYGGAAVHLAGDSVIVART